MRETLRIPISPLISMAITSTVPVVQEETSPSSQETFIDLLSSTQWQHLSEI